MRTVNNNISEKSYIRLKRREAKLRKQRRMFAVFVLICASLGILLGTSINALASSKADVASYNKYYTSIRIESGDTLWNLADEYIADLNIDKQEYIKEICEINSICENDIHAGDYIVVAYYSKDMK